MLYEVILDSGETANKCTIAPLAYRTDFRVILGKGAGPLGPLSAPILLHHEGVCLTTLRESLGVVTGISCIDCVWRRVDGLLKRIVTPLPQCVKIPDGFKTAYPRRSYHDFDPDQGLATIEAIFIAAAIVGNWDPSLLSHYYFGRKFVELNKSRFLDLGVSQAADVDALPVVPTRSKNSQQRRRDRGHY